MKKKFKNNLPGFQLMKINKMPTESFRFICKCENHNKGFAPFSVQKPEFMTTFSQSECP